MLRLSATQEQLTDVTERWEDTKTRFDEWRRQQEIKAQEMNIPPFIIPAVLVSIPLIGFAVFRKRKK